MFVHFVVLFLTLTSVPGSPVDQIDQVLINSNRLFTANVYKEMLKNGDDNFIVSPFSAEAALAFAQSGARGETQQELRQGLHQSQIENRFKSLSPKLKSENVYSFHVANKLYLQGNFTIKEDFQKVATDVSYSDTAKPINEWVEAQTEKKIQNLKAPHKLDASTVAVLVNALYFKANWSNPFTRYGPHQRTFFIDKTVNQAEMMYESNTVRHNYAEVEDLDARIVELPLQGGDVSMVLVLPKEKTGITRLEKQIGRVFQRPNFTRRYVRVSLPIFKTKSKIDFKEILKNLGVRKPFKAGADFSGTSDTELLISDVIQKTYIDVNEDGVEAAAATYGPFNKKSGLSLHAALTDFQANHSFIYYIKVKELIVFAGRVGAPTY